MTNEELAMSIQSGQEELIHALWQNIERFTRKQANRLLLIRDSSYPEFDDFYNTGYIALYEAVKTFDIKRGMSFIGWYKYYLKKAYSVLCGVRTSKTDVLNNCKSLNEPINDEGIELWEIVADSNNSFEDVEREIFNEQLHEAIERALNGLTPVEADIIRRSYYTADTARTISQETGLPVQAVNNKRIKGLRELYRNNHRELEQFLDDRTPYYTGTGLSSFTRTGSSAVERAVIKRERIRQKIFP